jgi:hypothetical protein
MISFVSFVGMWGFGSIFQLVTPSWHKKSGLNPAWGIRSKAVTVPAGRQSVFRDDFDHCSGSKAVADSGRKPITDWRIPDSVIGLIPK